ncbi:MAG: transposase [Microcystis sp. M04BS1]|nr:transposase [Microcystis sp. M04BS1]
MLGKAWFVFHSSAYRYNASIHQKETLEPILQEVGARLEFLPPYSPDFSPIENCWSKGKILIRSMSPSTYADLEKAIVQAFSQITLRDIHHWFTHCCYCDTPFKEPTETRYKMKLKFLVTGQLKATRAISENFGIIEKIEIIEPTISR